ncbi:hypothetical protein TrRE_jg1241 [Triparma retinervis]|uniref:Uncharacterized protein n=1 Tax=Triparma retinervis TaxID=2557542 RepID=A0A9W7EG70_9STRA|nr:hypothetical protein TrRE_jg1241 [Triparma retinervis]
MPDSSGNFPIHLACLGEDEGRLGGYVGCVEALLEQGGVPVKVRDGNKHTIIMAAARGGRRGMLEFASHPSLQPILPLIIFAQNRSAYWFPFLTAVSQAGDRSLTFRIIFGLTLFLHLSIILSSNWSLHLTRFLQYTTTPATSTTPPTHLLIIPPPNSGDGGITEVKTVQLRTERGVEREEERAEFQGIVWKREKGSKGEFKRTEFPISNPLTSYLTSTGLNTSTAPLSLYTYGPNIKSLPTPSFLRLLTKQLAAPFFIFQILCCVLWSLDEYWYYAIFTLLMLVFFECTVVWQRVKGLEGLRSSASRPPSPTVVYRGGRWTTVNEADILVGDVLSLKRPEGGYYRSKDGATRRARADELPAVPCDLLLMEGTAVVNEAMLTGESVPQLKEGVGGLGEKEKEEGSLLRTMAYKSGETSVNSKDTFAFIGMLLVFAAVAAGIVVKEGLQDEDRNR